MFNYIAKEWNTLIAVIKGDRFRRDFYRQLAMFAMALLALIPMWDASQVIIYFIGATGLLGMGVHLLRIIFFPHISLDALAADAQANKNIASALVFCSIVLFMCTLFVVAGQMIGIK